VVAVLVDCYKVQELHLLVERLTQLQLALVVHKLLIQVAELLEIMAAHPVFQEQV
jgi:hypothetical protein